MDDEGKVAVITGGGQGIGKAVAGRLLESGMKVVIAEIDEEAGRETEEEFMDRGEIMFIHTNISDEKAVQSMISGTMQRFRRLDALINNAAISINKPLADLSLAEWNRVISVNLTGAFLCSKYASPFLRESKGVIINISSTRALMSEPDTEAYSASKGGIAALTHSMAVSLGPEVRVNCISPGWIEVGGMKKKRLRRTPELSELDHRQHPAGRVGRPEDISSLVRYLLSDEASFITGANFVVDGGMTRKMIYV
ncbi:MAG: glucose 1-dehydrogenase [Nitrospirota bacterium]|nr:glucose 1-dehydrogenase [Nitrospirota bacterium]